MLIILSVSYLFNLFTCLTPPAPLPSNIVLLYVGMLSLMKTNCRKRSHLRNRRMLKARERLLPWRERQSHRGANLTLGRPETDYLTEREVTVLGAIH